MPTRVNLPDGTIGEFPDGMSESDIERVLQKQFGGPSTNRPAGLPAGVDLPQVAAHPVATMTEPTGSSIIPAALTAGEAIKGLAKGGLHTGSTLLHAANAPILPMPNGNTQVSPLLNHVANRMEQRSHPNSTAQRVGRNVEQAGEFLIPGAGEEDAVAHAAPLLERFLPEGAARVAAKAGVAGLGSGLVNKAQGGGFGIGALTGAGGSLAGQGMAAVAPALAETALRVRGNDRLFGRTVGDAILNDTKGVYPSTVARTAQETINSINPELEQRAADAGASGVRGSLLPSRQGVADTINKHLTNRAVESAGELEPLASRLTVDPVTHLPLAENQSPTGLLNLKRGINSDFIQNWRPDQPPGLKSSARGAYGAINDEFHNAVPGSQELDQRVSSLIPVTKRAEAVSHNAGVLQRTAGRLMAHTGAGLFGGLGAAGGYKEGGIPGAIAGGLTGIVAPEMLSSPTAQMIMARSMYSPVTQRLLIPAASGSVLQLNRPKDIQ